MKDFKEEILECVEQARIDYELENYEPRAVVTITIPEESDQ